MKFLFMSGTGESLGLAYRLQQERHEVVCWVREGHAKQNYGGMLRKTSRWENHLRSETVVVFDSIGGGKTADRLRSEGFRVYGSSVFADQVEFDLPTTEALLEEVGLPLTKTPIGPLWAIDGWFNGSEIGSQNPWSKNVLYSIKRTRLCDNDRGPKTPCMGVLTWMKQEFPPLMDKLTPLLLHHRYEGPVALTLDAEGHVVDWVLRLTFDIWSCNYQFFHLGVTGYTVHDLPYNLYQAGLRVVLPSYGTHKKVTPDISLGFTRSEYGYYGDVKLNKTHSSTAYRGNLITCMASSPLPELAIVQATNQAYQQAIPNAMFRTDLVESFRSDLKQLGPILERLT